MLSKFILILVIFILNKSIKSYNIIKLKYFIFKWDYIIFEIINPLKTNISIKFILT